MKNKIKALSLFDGISGARQALKNLGIECEYYASEIDKFAMQVSRENNSDIIQLGDVKKINYCTDLHLHWREGADYKEQIVYDFDLLIGGSPCQDLSAAGKGAGLEGERSGLFFEYVRILNEVKPKFFVLENVASMKKESRDKISEILGIQPVMINSALLTAQQRKRYYWVGRLIGDKYEQVLIEQPEDSGVLLKDIIESGEVDRIKSYCIDANYYKGGNAKSYFEKGRRQLIFKEREKSACLPATYYKKNLKSLLKRNKQGLMVIGCALRGRNIVDGKRKDILGAKTEQRLEFRNDEKINCLTSVSKDSLVAFKDLVRKLTPIECERLQGFPDNYTNSVSNTQRYKSLGNSFTVPVIEHILKQFLTP